MATGVVYMSRGIHRFVVRMRQHEVQVRAQSQSDRGGAYTVGSAKASVTKGDKKVLKLAVKQLIESFYPKTT